MRARGAQFTNSRNPKIQKSGTAAVNFLAFGSGIENLRAASAPICGVRIFAPEKLTRPSRLRAMVRENFIAKVKRESGHGRAGSW
jgi:hypothetical protein